MSLTERIARRIQAKGPISLADYMGLALGDVESGYYMTGEPFGLQGDFVTAPEISQIFGELCGIWLAECWQQHNLVSGGTPQKAHLVELGPGRGTLMNDLLRATLHISHFHGAVDVHMVEMSPRLRTTQQKLLDGKHPRIYWHEEMPDLDGPIFIIANEFFDALPIRQFIADHGKFAERRIGWNEDAQQFEFVLSEPQATLPADYPAVDAKRLPAGSIIELCPLAQRINHGIAEQIKQKGGAMLAIDYGYDQPADGMEFAAGDTLQAVYKHQYHNVLNEPGKADVTAHVDFATLGKIAAETGCAVSPVISQRDFLIKMGGKLRIEQLMSSATNPDQQNHLAQGFERLTSKTEMGTLFKALAICHPSIKPPVF